MCTHHLTNWLSTSHSWGRISGYQVEHACDSTNGSNWQRIQHMNTNPTQGIRELILNKRGDRSLEALSRACGGTPTRANLDRLINKPVLSWPKENAVIIGLAKGLGVRVIDVVTAYAESLGLPIVSDMHDMTLPGAGALPESSQRVLRDMSENMLWWQEQTEISHTQAEVASVHELFPPDKQRLAADKGDKGIDPEQLPED